MVSPCTGRSPFAGGPGSGRGVRSQGGRGALVRPPRLPPPRPGPVVQAATRQHDSPLELCSAPTRATRSARKIPLAHTRALTHASRPTPASKRGSGVVSASRQQLAGTRTRTPAYSQVECLARDTPHTARCMCRAPVGRARTVSLVRRGGLLRPRPAEGARRWTLVRAAAAAGERRLRQGGHTQCRSHNVPSLSNHPWHSLRRVGHGRSDCGSPAHAHGRVRACQSARGAAVRTRRSRDDGMRRAASSTWPGRDISKLGASNFD